MDLKRLLSSDSAKGSINYIRVQRRYELAKTIGLFAISLALFLAGFLTTHTKRNLLTIVAVLGMLPACKSLVNTIMFFRFAGCNPKMVDKSESIMPGRVLYDCIFTTYDKNYEIDALFVGENEIIGYSDKKTFAGKDKEFTEYLTKSLANDGIKGMTIKIFDDSDKYLERLKAKTEDGTNMAAVTSILSVIL